jgi:hypothetical protein
VAGRSGGAGGAGESGGAGGAEGALAAAGPQGGLDGGGSQPCSSREGAAAGALQRTSSHPDPGRQSHQRSSKQRAELPQQPQQGSDAAPGPSQVDPDPFSPGVAAVAGEALSGGLGTGGTRGAAPGELPHADVRLCAQGGVGGCLAIREDSLNCMP